MSIIHNPRHPSLCLQYVDTSQLSQLTRYLQALHRHGSVNHDHTALLLNCYTRVRDTDQLDAFIQVCVHSGMRLI